MHRLTNMRKMLLVMLAARDVTLDQVLAELERREGTSGIAEKAARG